MTRAEYRDALVMHDHARAAELLPEWVDLTYLCAAARAALYCQRRRWVAPRQSRYGPPQRWPLSWAG